MREIIAVCRSAKKAREKAARILDRYLWRIGDRTWRGRASNACLDRIARDLRKDASKNMAVAISLASGGATQRRPLIFVGSRRLFSAEGLVPISTAPAERTQPKPLPPALRTHRAALQVAAWFHDLGKATSLFQEKLRRSLQVRGPRVAEADVVRHEAISALAWDALCGDLEDADLIARLGTLSATDIDQAMATAADRAFQILASAGQGNSTLSFEFAKKEDSLAALIGLLILGHHRLPDMDGAHRDFLANVHFRLDDPLPERRLLGVAPGTPYWHEPGWMERLHEASKGLSCHPMLRAGSDIWARSCLMLGDHLGSALKQPGDGVGHLANTARYGAISSPMDSLATHVRRVCQEVRHAFQAVYTQRHAFPALREMEILGALRHPHVTDARFAWQAIAAEAAGRQVATGAGGFFGCLIAGTGTGKTRAAPTILTAATVQDVLPDRRGLRFVLGLGLRSLASQSAREYLDDLGFAEKAVSVLVGTPPLTFPEEASEQSGSEDRLSHLSAFEIENARSHIPEQGSAAEADWLAGLSFDCDRTIPAFFSRLAEKDAHGDKLLRLLEAPILCATIDHLMPVTAPQRSRHLPAALRLISSDLILDEIDQYDAEDLAAVARLVHLAGVAGRRVLIMSATLPDLTARSLYEAYRRGWSEYAALFDLPDRVHHCITGHLPASCRVGEEDFQDHLAEARSALLADLEASPPLRRAEVLEVGDTLVETAQRIGEACSRLHECHAVEIDGLTVSVGLVRLTRISHVTAIAAYLPEPAPDRIRLRVCLHARMPRIQRAWIERMLKRALTRKGGNPNAGLRDLLIQEKVFERAASRNAKNVEIIVVASPVIETGNDLDFDYGVLDPSSLRALIQSGGRINRHRCLAVASANVLILSKPLVTLEGRGLIAFPGVETDPGSATMVSRVRVTDRAIGATGRTLIELFGGEVPDRIDARPFLDPEQDFPMLRAETELVRRFLQDPHASLDTWTSRHLPRHAQRFSNMRKFRRQSGFDVEIFATGQDLDELNWNHVFTMADALPAPLALGRAPLPARHKDFLFEYGRSSLEKAWDAMFPDEGVTPHRLRRMTKMSLQVYALDEPIGPLIWDLRYGLARPFPEE